MARKLSNKYLREIVTAGLISFDGIVEVLDKAQAAYNEHTLRGFIEDATNKGWLKQDENGMFAIHRKTSGGGTPTHLYRVDKALTPEKAKMVSKPYTKDLEDDEDAGWKRTKLAAIRAAKTAFYMGVAAPGVEVFRNMEAEEVGEPEEESAAA